MGKVSVKNFNVFTINNTHLIFQKIISDIRKHFALEFSDDEIK